MSLTLNPVLLRRLLLSAVLIFSIWATWEVSTDTSVDKSAAEHSVPVRRTQTKPAGTVAVATPTLGGSWPLRGDQGEDIVDLFSIPAPPPLIGASGALGAAPILPVLKLKYVGRLLGNGNDRVFLSDAQDRVITTRVGEDVGDGWRLAVMEPRQLVFRHAASGQEQTMQIGAFQ